MKIIRTNTFRTVAALIMVSVYAITCVQAQHSERAHYLGRVVEPFQLLEPTTSKQWDLDANTYEATATVIYMMGTECPVNNLYVPVLNELAKNYRSDGVVFLAINSNAHDSAAEIVEHVRNFSISFPVLQDQDGAVARRLGAKRTTEVFLLDSQRKIRFCGRVDDRFERGVLRPKTDNHFLVNALDAVLSNSRVHTPLTDVTGCPIRFAGKPAAMNGDSGSRVTMREPKQVTFARDVSRILQHRCQSCHHPGDIGPFSLMTYADAVDWSDSIREVVTEGLMPPWNAAGRHGHFANDRRLTPAEYDILLNWIDTGCEEGNVADLPPPIKFDSDWQISDPDLVLRMNGSFDVPASIPEGGVPYKYFWAGERFEEECWVEAAEVKPGNRSVVHHVIVFIVTEKVAKRLSSRSPKSPEVLNPPVDSMASLVSFVPGDQLFEFPRGFAKRIPRGARLLMEMHYTPNGKAGVDQSSVAIRFADEPPRHEVKGDAAINFLFAIPPNKANYRVVARWRAKSDLVLLSMNPHMHYRGKSYRYELVRPDGSEETLLFVPQYDFNWQSTYILANPVRIPKRSVIKCTALFDNSTNNLFNPDPSKWVTWGDQTWEEMMLGYFEYYEVSPTGRK